MASAGLKLTNGDYALKHSALESSQDHAKDIEQSWAPCLSVKLNTDVLDMVMSAVKNKRRKTSGPDFLATILFKEADGKATAELGIGDKAASLGVELNKATSKTENQIFVGSRERSGKVMTTLGKVRGKAYATTINQKKTISRIAHTAGMIQQNAKNNSTRKVGAPAGLQFIDIHPIVDDAQLEIYIEDYNKKKLLHNKRSIKVLKIKRSFEKLGKEWDKATDATAKQAAEAKIKKEYNEKIKEYESAFAELKQLKSYSESLKKEIIEYTKNQED